MQRGTSLSTGMHVDPAMLLNDEDLDEEGDESDAPPGAVRFALEADEIADALAAESAGVGPLTLFDKLCPAAISMHATHFAMPRSRLAASWLAFMTLMLFVDPLGALTRLCQNSSMPIRTHRHSLMLVCCCRWAP